ncbi:MAG: helix-turn-helix transcriptional regulator [Clostridia bacterium]|nr:helix-turn-helix transcriptional regulator [Clostridia bacterium]
MNRLKELRIEKSLLQSDIAKIINKSERTVGFYETGERDMNTETLATLADYFGVSIDYLLGKSDIRNPEQQEDPLGLAKIGFSMKDYNPPTDKQREQLAELIKIVLKDNKKDKEGK